MARFKEQEREDALDQNRRRLLEAAADAFGRAGFDGANINAISTAAGFAKGTIYNYFPSKQALLLALVDYVARLQVDFLRERVLSEADPARRLEAFFQAGFEVVERYYPHLRVMFNIIYGPDAEQKAYIYRAYQPMFELFAGEILVPGIQTGVFRAVDPQGMTSLLMTIYLGTASHTTPEGKPLLDAGQVIDLVKNGLLT